MIYWTETAGKLVFEMNEKKGFKSDDWRTVRLYVKILKSFRCHRKKLAEKGIDAGIWEGKFINSLKSGDDRCEELLTEFLSCQIEKVTHHRRVRRKNSYAPILFCVIRNEIYRVKVFMKHYRNLGIEAFVFLDNNSDDGTAEFLRQQEDVILYTSSQQYSSARRVAWLNRLMAIYGQNRWCLVVDSDEFVTYIGCEKYSLPDLVKRAVRNNCNRVEGFMLDMYPKGELFGDESGRDDSICQYRYFDTLSYQIDVAEKRVIITGGPRKRVFQTDVILSKYPLFFFREDDFAASSHFMVPCEPIKRCPVWIALCHYKFVNDRDLCKIKEAVRKGNYAGGSILYKKYLSTIKEKHGVRFYEEGNSCEMISSGSLRKIPFLKDPFSGKK